MIAHNNNRTAMCAFLKIKFREYLAKSMLYFLKTFKHFNIVCVTFYNVTLNRIKKNNKNIRYRQQANAVSRFFSYHSAYIYCQEIFFSILLLTDILRWFGIVYDKQRIHTIHSQYAFYLTIFLQQLRIRHRLKEHYLFPLDLFHSHPVVSFSPLTTTRKINWYSYRLKKYRAI